MAGSDRQDFKNVDHLAKSIRASSSDTAVRTTLKTDERVIARVTDGIYRQPGSALRELISNAYDADATRVTIKTDAPRFERISIEDNGRGMEPEALARLVLHIGGSAKRSREGSALGITARDDPLRSPGGRRLIGKIGIGLFSISQLTHTFQIITKVKNDDHRTIATVALRQHSDEDFIAGSEGEQQFEAGQVNIWREPAADHDSQGTTIILSGIRMQSRSTLRSREIWDIIEQGESSSGNEDDRTLDPPRFHIGRVDRKNNELLKPTNGRLSAVPWSPTDSPEEAFKKLVSCVWDESSNRPNQKLDTIFDYYLRIIWQLSLAVPLPYVDGHPFDMTSGDWAEAFLLSNQSGGAAQEIPAGVMLRQHSDLTDTAVDDFEVLFDDLKLARPVRFRGLPMARNVLKRPLIFVGKHREEFPNIPRELSGGPLAFEAYLFWTPKVAPVEHQGSLIRIHGSSGTLFDPTFMRYQISELTRLRQITCEIFVSEGLDSALNIDRESFNHAHPHSVYITRWLHNALRQLASAQKRLSAGALSAARDSSAGQQIAEIQRVARDVWKRETDDVGSSPPAVDLSETGQRLADGEAYVFRRSAIMPDRGRVQKSKIRAQDAVLGEKIKAIAQVLAAYGLLDAVTPSKQETLLRAIYEILDAPEE